MNNQKCFGIAGWKNSGKTSLVSNLVREMRSRGLNISTIKHAHHAFDLDQPHTDSFKHREAGAGEVMLVSSKRWAVQHELGDAPEPSFEEMLSKLSPCDLVLVEGYKGEPIPKLEIIGPENARDQLWKRNDMIKAIACDDTITECDLPQFRRDDTMTIADYILNLCEVL